MTKVQLPNGNCTFTFHFFHSVRGRIMHKPYRFFRIYPLN